MGKIATEQEAYSIAGGSESTTSKICCTKARAVQIGCDVEGKYLDTQLVEAQDLKKALNIIEISFEGTAAWMMQKIKAVFRFPITINMQFNIYGDYQGTTYNQIYTINQQWYPVGSENHPDEYTWYMQHNQPLDNITQIMWNPFKDQDGREFDVKLLVPKVNKFNKVISIGGDYYLAFQYPTIDSFVVKDNQGGELQIPIGTQFIKTSLGSGLVVEGSTYDTYLFSVGYYPVQRGFLVEREHSADSGSYGIGLYKNGNFSENTGGIMITFPLSGSELGMSTYFRYVAPEERDYEIYIGAIPVGTKMKFRGDVYTQSKSLERDNKETYEFHYPATSFEGATLVYS